MMGLWTPIPGETPIDDVSGLKLKGITTRKQLNVAEAQNILKPLAKYLGKKPSRRSAPFDYSWSLRLHKEMLGKVWRWAGKLRQTDKNIGVPWPQIEARLYSLLADLALWEEQGTPTLLEQAVWLHHKAVFIHPFENGNGRWSRLLANIWLKLHDHPVIGWLEETVGAESAIRTEYLQALKQADEGDYDSLIALHKRFTP